MTFFCTLRHEIMTGVMILLQALHDGGYEFAPSGMVFGHAVTSLNKQKRGSACKKARYSILVSLFIYSKHTTTTTLMWCVRLWAVALAYAWLARMPVCTVLDSCASIVADHLVDSLAAP